MKKTNPDGYPVETWINRHINRWFIHIDDVILMFVAFGLIIAAIKVLAEGFSDFTGARDPITHIISDLMFVLIIMELFRQVIRQLMRHKFSLSPFLFIGVIASTRGILIIQMKLAESGANIWDGLSQIGIYAVVVLIMVICFYFSSKAEKNYGQENSTIK